MKVVYSVVFFIEVMCFIITLINSASESNSMENRKLDLICSLVFLGMILIECFLMSFGKI